MPKSSPSQNRDRFAPLKKLLPVSLWKPLRGVGTALLAPALSAYRSGHLRSSLQAMAVWRNGQPIPWYTYPCIELLFARAQSGLFRKRRVLEFGAGQSTLWWAGQAAEVVALEAPGSWYERLRRKVPANVRLIEAAAHSAEACVAAAEVALADAGQFDVVVIDGLWRSELIAVALHHLAPGGAILCDNAEGYGIHEGFLAHSAGRQLLRADFFGQAPGVIWPHCTSIYFQADCFLFSAAAPIPDPLTLHP